MVGRMVQIPGRMPLRNQINLIDYIDYRLQAFTW